MKGMGKKGRGKLQKDMGGHAVPGRTGQDGAPGKWEARTGYTSERKTGGAGPKSRQGVSYPGKNA
jgi:hypothetical protein